jgi:hypothetical protein
MSIHVVTVIQSRRCLKSLMGTVDRRSLPQLALSRYVDQSRVHCWMNRCYELIHLRSHSRSTLQHRERSWVPC